MGAYSDAQGACRMIVANNYEHVVSERKDEFAKDQSSQCPIGHHVTRNLRKADTEVNLFGSIYLCF